MIRRDDWFLSWLAVAFGVTIIGCHLESGQARWAAAAWHYAVRVLLYGHARKQKRARMIGYWLAFAWFCVLNGAALLAVFDDIDGGTRLANPLAVVAWTAFAYLYVSRALEIRKSR